MRQIAEPRHKSGTDRRASVPVGRRRRLALLCAAAAMAAAVSAAGTPAGLAAPSSAGHTALAACDAELAHLVRLSRNATPGSAAHFRVVEEIDRIVWP